MRVNSMTVTLKDEEGKLLSTTVDIPGDQERDLKKARDAIRRARYMIGPKVQRSHPRGDGYSTTFSTFYLAELDRVLKEALEVVE